jgi:hypothetical protein
MMLRLFGGSIKGSQNPMTNAVAMLPAARAVVSEHLPPALSPARERLRQALTIEAVAQREVGALGEKIGRLQAVLSDETAAMARTAECRDLDRKRLGDWLANPVGPRPQKSVETDEAETNQLSFAVDAAAARATLGAIEAQQRAAIERREKGSADQSMAAAEVLAGEIAPILLSELKSRLEAALQVEAKLRALVDLFRSQQTGVMSFAEPVEGAINSVRRSAAVRHEDQWAIEYWQSLAADPLHGLGR